MAYEFKLPDLGEGIAEVELRAWLVKPGERIREHQPLAEVETDKAVVEIPSPRSGTIVQLVCRAGESVRVGETLLLIAEGDDLPQKKSTSVGIVGELPEAEEERPVLALPAVRRQARELGINLGGVVGSGPRGSITREDLERHSSGRQSPTSGSDSQVERVPMKGIRRVTARNVLASQRSTAAVTSTEEADVTPLWELRQQEQQTAEHLGIHLTFLPFFIKAVQHALREHPYLNAAIDDSREEILLKKEYHFGIAMETVDGLMVPVIRNVGEKSIIDLAAELQSLGKKAADRSISREEMQGSSFTITNYGPFGGLFATPIINWPDVAILGFGRIVDRPWVHQGQIAIRKILPLSLTFDHRVTDGVDANRFMTRVVKYLEDPGALFIDSR